VLAAGCGVVCIAGRRVVEGDEGWFDATLVPDPLSVLIEVNAARGARGDVLPLLESEM